MQLRVTRVLACVEGLIRDKIEKEKKKGKNERILDFEFRFVNVNEFDLIS